LAAKTILAAITGSRWMMASTWVTPTSSRPRVEVSWTTTGDGDGRSPSTWRLARTPSRVRVMPTFASRVFIG
jgi:hypothetical protein